MFIEYHTEEDYGFNDDMLLSYEIIRTFFYNSNSAENNNSIITCDINIIIACDDGNGDTNVKIINGVTYTHFLELSSYNRHPLYIFRKSEEDCIEHISKMAKVIEL